MTGSSADTIGRSQRPLALHRSRLQPPRPLVPPVSRRALVEKLLHTSAPLVLLSSPAGWGKTMVLKEWSESDPRPAAWLQLDPSMNDQVLFLAYLLGALGEVVPLDAATSSLLASPMPPVHERILPLVCDKVADARPFLLVLDNAHAVEDVACWRILAEILMTLPLGGQIALASRDAPPMALARMRASGALAEFGVEDLAFSASEARELLEAQRGGLDAGAVERVYEATEGWPAGLYLASLAGRDLPAAEWSAHVRGDQPDIAAFMGDEVFGGLPPERREFLSHTSILDTLSADACRAITGLATAADELERLARENSFIVRLDDTGLVYRYHRLLREFLRAELARRSPAGAQRLHRLAADWFWGCGEPEPAIRHWLQAGDVAAAAGAVAGSWMGQWRAGRRETVRRWLGWFSDQEILDDKALTLTAGWVYSALDDAELGERWGRAACTLRMDDQPSPDGAASLLASQTLLRATLAPDGIGRMREDAELALSLESAGNSWHVEALDTLGTARWLSGAPRTAIHPLEQAAKEGLAFNPVAELVALGTLALVYSDMGEWTAAGLCSDKAARRQDELKYGSSRRTLPMFLAQARVAAHRGGGDVPAMVARVDAMLGTMVPHRWMEILAGVLLGEVCMETSEPALSQVWVNRARQAISRYPDSGMLKNRLDRLEAAVASARILQPLSPAERKVLQLLPTHLTEDGIAQELFLSRNTVKTHARSIYRKLDVRSRAEAVEKAKRLGLL